MLRRQHTRTGIDLGSASVKVVCGEGRGRLEQVTHVGVAEYGTTDTAQRETPEAALRRLLGRLGLRSSQLGRIAVAIGGDQVSLREALVPELSEAELRRALPFEAKKHLLLEGIQSPQLDAQILGPAESSADGLKQMRVLFAAASATKKEWVLRTLGSAGLEPEVIDLEPLSLLNALYSEQSGGPESWGAQAMLDLGGSHTRLHIGHPLSGLLTRTVGGKLPGPMDDPETFLRSVGRNIRETLTYYRGHHRRAVAHLRVCGGGATRPDLVKGLCDELEIDLSAFDVMEAAPGAAGWKDAEGAGPRLPLALGLARWWDGDV